MAARLRAADRRRFRLDGRCRVRGVENGKGNDVRIIAGEHRGRRLEAPKGDGTRPTIDRVRESLMSALASARGGFDDAVVLDAFAGSGALGLEALSRGAACACFCEKDASAAKVVEANIYTLGYSRDVARLLRIDVLKSAPSRMRRPYDLIMLDPPYATSAREVFSLLSRLDDACALAPGALITYEHDADDCEAVDEQISASRFHALSRKKYGGTVIDILEKPEEE